MNAVPLVRAFGYEIRVHLSWALVLAVIAVTVAGQVEDLFPGTTPVATWVVAVVLAGSVLLSVVIHELGHAVVGRRVGIPPEPVVVYFFGAAASPAVLAGRPRDEIAVALGGPAVSLLVAAFLLPLAIPASVLGSGFVEIAGGLALVVGSLNLVLGLVNLLPAFPLDGGRIVRGLAWARSGDPSAALRVAAVSGRVLGLGLAGTGVLVILLADSLNGVMVALCGWFLVATASSLRRQAQFETLLGGLRVGEVMDREVQGVPPGLTLDTFASRVLDGTVSPTLPVMRGVELLGIVGAAQLRRVRRDRWTTLRASDVMAAGSALPAVGSETPVRSVLDALRRTGLDGLPVVDGGVVTGVVTRRGIAEALRSRSVGHDAAAV